MHTIRDTSAVRVLSANVVEAGFQVGPAEWHGSLAEFERDNQFDDATCAEVRTALHQTGRWVTGGGAAALFVVEVLDFAVTVLASVGRRTFRCASQLEAQVFAAAFLSRMPNSVAVTVTDLERGEVVFHSAPVSQPRTVPFAA